MVNYAEGKIYKIISNNIEKIYIGGTTKRLLSQRLSKHVNHIKRYNEGRQNDISSRQIIEAGDYKIVLIERYPCESKDELAAREQFWIDQNKDICVNKNNAKGINIEKKKKRTKEYDEVRPDISCDCCGNDYSSKDYTRHMRSRKHENNVKFWNKMLKTK